MNRRGSKTALGDIRLLDLVDEKGLYCTKLLADLGADVIKIEKPGGDATRATGPFFHDEPHIEKSLYFFNLNTNKRSITLNLGTLSGRKIFRKLAKTADVIVETFQPGYLEGIRLGYSTLREINPGLILTSITGFGQSGPYRDYKASDVVGVAMGGLMYLGGFPEDPPNRPYGSQAYHMASLHAAVGTLIALYDRELSGEGQHIDISMQEAVSLSAESAAQYYDLRGEILRRLGRARVRVVRGRYPAVDVYPCKDGYMLWEAAFHGWDALVQWMDSEGVAGDLKDKKWQDVQYRLEEADHIDELFIPFVTGHTKEELHDEGQKRGIMVVPVNSPEDLLNDPQLLSRGYFVDIWHDDLETNVKYPGAPYRFSETPWKIVNRAPLIGEHNLEIYERELGFSRQQLAILEAEGAI